MWPAKGTGKASFAKKETLPGLTPPNITEVERSLLYDSANWGISCTKLDEVKYI